MTLQLNHNFLHITSSQMYPVANMNHYNQVAARQRSQLQQSQLFNMSLKAAIELSSTNQEDESTAIFENHKNQQEAELSNTLQNKFSLEGSQFSIGQQNFSKTEESTLKVRDRSLGSSQLHFVTTTDQSHISIFQPIPILHLYLKNNFHNKYETTGFNTIPRLRQIVHSRQENITCMKLYKTQLLLLTGTRQGSIISYLLNESSLPQLYQVYDYNDGSFKSVYKPTEKQKTHLKAPMDTTPAFIQQVSLYPISSIDVSKYGYLAVGDISGQLKIYSIQTTLQLVTKMNYNNEIKNVKWDYNGKHQLFVVCRQFIVYINLLRQKQKTLKIAGALSINFNSEFIFVNQERQISVFSRNILSFDNNNPLKPLHLITVHSSKGKNASPQQIQYTTQTQTMNELIVATKDMRTRVYSTWSGTQLQKFKNYDVKKNLQIVNINTVPYEGQIKKQGILQEGYIRRTNPEQLVFVFKQGIIAMMEKFYTCGNVIEQNKQQVKSIQPVDRYQYDVQDKVIWIDINDLVQSEPFKLTYQFISKGYKVNIVDSIVLTQLKIMQKVGEVRKYVYGIVVAMEDGTIWIFDITT